MEKITGKLLRYNRKQKEECKYADSPHLYTDPFPIHPSELVKIDEEHASVDKHLEECKYADSPHLYTDPFPIHPSELVKIDEEHASVDKHLGGANMKQFLSNTEGYIEFQKQIHFPFVSPHNVQYFCVSYYHEALKGVKEFNAIFTTSSGEKVVKEYEYETYLGKCSWQLFPVDLDDIVQCDLESLKCWDGSVVESSRLYSIRFLTKDFEFIDQPCIPGECMEIYPGHLSDLDSKAYGKVLCGPYPVDHPQVVMVDVPKAFCRFTNGHGQSDLEKFLAGKGKLCFFPSLYIPFTSPHYIGEFCLLIHNYINGIKRFDATFTDSSGKRIVKKYEIAKRTDPEKKLFEKMNFWASFSVDLSNVVSCKILIQEPWGGTHNKNSIKGIRFIGNPEEITRKWRHQVGKQIDSLVSQLSDNKKQIDSLQTTITTQGDVIRKQEETIHKQMSEISSCKSLIHTQAEQITTLLSTTSQLQTTISKHKTTISEHRSDLDGHSKQLEDTISLIGQHRQHSDQQGSMLERTCTSLQSELSALSVRVAGQSVSVAQRVQDEHDQVIEHRRSFVPDLDTLIPLSDEDSVDSH
ncbi:hypothetical protein ADUPG1_011065, partial [Aduncisulcus paluster]